MLREGGAVEQVLHALTLNMLPGAIPDAIEVDVSELQPGGTIRVADLRLPDGRDHPLGHRGAGRIRALARRSSRRRRPEAAEPAEEAARAGRRRLSRCVGGKGDTPTDLLVVGLGNPGAEYAGTRHNVGAGRGRSAGVAPRRQAAELEGARAHGARCASPGERVALAFPQTYMNDSGPVRRCAGPPVRRRRPGAAWSSSTTSSTCRSAPAGQGGRRPRRPQRSAGRSATTCTRRLRPRPDRHRQAARSPAGRRPRAAPAGQGASARARRRASRRRPTRSR